MRWKWYSAKVPIGLPKGMRDKAGLLLNVIALVSAKSLITLLYVKAVCPCIACSALPWPGDKGKVVASLRVPTPISPVVVVVEVVPTPIDLDAENARMLPK